MGRYRRHHRPPGETKRERRLQRVVGTGVVVVFLLLGLLGFGEYINYRSQTNHHNASAHQQNTIIAQNKIIETDTKALVAYHAQTVAILGQIKALQVEFTDSVAKIPAVAAALTAGQNALIADLNNLTYRMDNLCAHLPASVCPAA